MSGMKNSVMEGRIPFAAAFPDMQDWLYFQILYAWLHL